MSEYRSPSPFSPKPDYKAMDIEQLKNVGSRNGLVTNLSKGRLLKTLDEIYAVTDQYETDTDFDWEEEIVSKDWMKCLDDQCITFTISSRKGVLTSVMTAKKQ